MVAVKKATLILEDGTCFEGKTFGAGGSTVGEVVFTTGAVGFQETITDPGCSGQIVVQTFPITGGYGFNSEESESAAASVAGYVVREWCEAPSNFRCEGTLDAFLKQRGVVGIADIDTRALTIHLREHGGMNGCITTEPVADKPALLEKLKAHRLQNAIERVSTAKPFFCGDENGKYMVALYDFGCKNSILQRLQSEGCKINILPYNTPLAAALALNPDGIVLSGGPGNPNDYKELAASLKPLLRGKTPVLGLGLGHQLLALAAGAAVNRLPQGHRGSNQAVSDTELGRTFVTSQNHGFAVEETSLTPGIAEVFCRNANDKTCEGIRYKTAPAFSIQFHPEAFTGTGNTHYYIDKFVEMMKRGK